MPEYDSVNGDRSRPSNSMSEDDGEHFGRGNWDDDYIKPSCFPFSASISTPSSEVPIGETYVGQIILSRRNDGVLVPRPIARKLVHGLAPLVKVEFTSGKSFKCVNIHSFLTDKGWLAVEEMHPGYKIVQDFPSDGQGIIKSITPTGTMEPVFNLYTQGEHNFIVNGCVAHNFTHFRTLRTILYRMFFDKTPEISVDNLSVQR